MSQRLDDWADEHDHTDRDLREAGAPDTEKPGFCGMDECTIEGCTDRLCVKNLSKPEPEPTGNIYLTNGVDMFALSPGTRIYGMTIERTGEVILYADDGLPFISKVLSSRGGNTLRAYTIEDKEENYDAPTPAGIEPEMPNGA